MKFMNQYGIVLDARIINTATGKTSDWLHLGRFFVSRRKRVGDILELTCYDAALKTQGNYFADGEDIGEWPQSMKTVAAKIADRIGVYLSIPSNLPDYPMEAPTGMTMRDVLSNMAAAWGGNWMIRAPGCVEEPSYSFTLGWKSILRLIPLGTSLGTYTAGKRAASAAAIGEKVSFSGVRIFWSDTDCFESGNCNNKPLECYCEWATQEMADNVWAAINGKSFQAFEASNAWLHPAVEPGDAITLNGITSQIITMRGSVNAGCAFDIGFPGAESEEDEYPYEGPVTKTLAKKVSLGRAYYGTTISREQGLTVKRSDGRSEAVFNSDVFSMRAKDSSGQMIDCIYFDALAQLYRIRGQVEIDGALVTQNLYADEGNIVELTVDSLLTSRRIQKRILQDVTDDNYISIQGNVARWISAQVEKVDGSPSSEIAKNKDNKPLYWTADPSTAQIVNGHYEIDGKRITTTTTNTGWPVMVYSYIESQSMSITFASDGTPIIQMGAGDADRALILKRSTGLQIDYINKDGKELYVKLDDSGRIICKDTLTSIDLSKLDTNETFTMTYGNQAVTYGLTKTDNGYLLTKPNGEGSVSIVT